MTIALEKVQPVLFPQATGITVNMMPFVFGDSESLPKNLQGWLPAIGACSLRHGSIAYLTIHESFVEAGKTQRRGGIHTEGFRPTAECAGRFGGGRFGRGEYQKWGGGWGGTKRQAGVYVASSDGACRIWDCLVDDVDRHGGLSREPEARSEKMDPKVLYWMTDRTPHEALPAESSGMRQFFRVVSEEVSVWFSKHNTPNPLGVQPSCPIVSYDKFAQV